MFGIIYIHWLFNKLIECYYNPEPNSNFCESRMISSHWKQFSDFIFLEKKRDGVK